MNQSILPERLSKVRKPYFLRFWFSLAVMVMMSVSVGWGQIVESFETGLPSSYTSTLQDATLGSGTWRIQDVIAGTTGVNSGTKSAQIRSATAAQMITPTLSGGVGIISFYVTSSTTSGAYQVNISTDNGATWSAAAGSPFTISTTKTLRSIEVNNSNVNRVQFYRTGATIYIDDVTITKAAPSTQASSLTFSNIGQTSLTANWTNGNGAKRVVIMNTSDSFTAPADGTDPTANTTYSGSGQQVVFNGTGNSVAVTGLTAATTYWFRVYEYNGSGSTTKYNTTTATNNPNSQATLAATSPTISVSTITAFGDQTVNTTSSEKSYSVSGTNLEDDIEITPPSGFEVSTATGENFSATNPITLSPTEGTVASTTIYVRFKPTAVTSYSGNIQHTSTNATTQNVAVSGTGTAPVDPTAVSATVASHSQINLAFTPNGSNQVMVAVNSSNTFGTPSGSYAVSDAISGGGTVIYKGSGSSYNHTGLAANTAYYYKVWTVDALDFYSSGVTTNATTNNLSASTATSGTSVSKTGFSANWGAVDGASGYRLDVATSNTFFAETPSVFASEGFNNSMPLFSASGGTYYDGNSATGDRPASSPFAIQGTHAYGISNGTATITSISINTTDYNNTELSFRLASFSINTTGNGADAGDIVTVEISPDNGINYYSNLRVLGNSNAFWTYSTGEAIASRTYSESGTPLDFQPSSGGNRTTDGYSTVKISGLPSVSSLKVRITLLNNADNERWIIDDLKLSGNLNTTLPSYSNLSVSGTTQTVTGLTPNSTYYYRVRATGGNSTSANSNVIEVTTTGTEATDQFRSVASGNWGSNATWQSKDSNVDWFGATAAPTSAAASVLLGAGHLVTVAANASSSAVTLEPDAKLNISADNTLTITGDLTLQSSGSGTATLVNSGTLSVSGTTTVQQHLATDRNWYMSSPFSNATAPAGNTYYEYREPGDNAEPVLPATAYWKSISQGAPLQTGKGYIVNPASAPATFSLSGSLNNGTLDPVSLTRTTGKDKEGFNLVGNPYPSYLNVSSINSNADLDKSFWLRSRNAGNTAWIFDSYNITGSEGTSNSGLTVSNLIPPMQAFWVRVSSGKTGATLTFNNNMRAHKDDVDNKFRAPASLNPLVRLVVSNGTNSDEAVIYFNGDAYDSYDAYDSPKMFNNNVAVPEIYTRAGNEQLVINGMSQYFAGLQLPLGFYAGQTNSFSIRASQLRNISADMLVVLKDKQLNTEFDLTAGEAYSFTSDATNTEDRFVVMFKSASGTTAVDNALAGNMFVSSANGKLMLQLNTEISNASVTVYNATGQSIYSQAVVSPTTVLSKTLEAGVYVVKVVNGGRTAVLRTVVR